MTNLIIISIWLGKGLYDTLRVYNEAIEEDRTLTYVIGCILYTLTWPLVIIGLGISRKLKKDSKEDEA